MALAFTVDRENFSLLGWKWLWKFPAFMLGWVLRSCALLPWGEVLQWLHWGVCRVLSNMLVRQQPLVLDVFTSGGSQLCSELRREANRCTVKLIALCGRRCTEFKILFFPPIELDRWRLLLIAMPHDPMELATPYACKEAFRDGCLCGFWHSPLFLQQTTRLFDLMLFL